MTDSHNADHLSRRRIYDDHSLQWYLNQVDEKITIRGQIQPNPAKSSAIFVVHGMGEQKPEETAALLRSGFDEALLKIQEWQIENGEETLPRDYVVPPPFIMDGFWGNYSEIDQTFPEDWAKFMDNQKEFFKNLWQTRTQSRFRAFRWMMRQLVRLIHPRTISDLGLLAWFVYLPYQITATATLLVSLVKAPKILTGFLGDLRLYLDPSGVTERAMVQRIDERVAKKFMRLLGMDRNFKSLEPKDWYQSCETPVRFDRVVWVAHSLGTVISYNVLADLFHKAEQIEAEHNKDKNKFADEFANVLRFRKCLRRFVTMGSPLDKVAYLFGTRAVTPWPKTDRTKMLDGGEVVGHREWWINFYSVLDPVSGALNSSLLCGNTSPINYHAASSFLPGYAHVGYWADSTVLRFILGRTYGGVMLWDRSPRPWPVWALTLLAIGFHAINFLVALIVLLVIIWWAMVMSGVYTGGFLEWLLPLI